MCVCDIRAGSNQCKEHTTCSSWFLFCLFDAIRCDNFIDSHLLFAFYFIALIRFAWFSLCLFLCRKSIECTDLGRVTNVERKTIRSVPKTAFHVEEVAGKPCDTDEDKIIDEDENFATGNRNKRIKSTTTSTQTPSRKTSSFFTSEFMFSTR